MSANGGIVVGSCRYVLEARWWGRDEDKILAVQGFNREIYIILDSVYCNFVYCLLPRFSMRNFIITIIKIIPTSSWRMLVQMTTNSYQYIPP